MEDVVSATFLNGVRALFGDDGGGNSTTFEEDPVELENPWQSPSIFQEVYTCENLELCMIKYICGGVSLIFVIVYGIAVSRI